MHQHDPLLYGRDGKNDEMVEAIVVAWNASGGDPTIDVMDALAEYVGTDDYESLIHGMTVIRECQSKMRESK